MASKVMDLIYWRDVGKTAVVFTGMVVGLACLFQLSLVTVVSNFLLAILMVTFPIRLLWKGLKLVRLSDGCHPFQSFLDEDLTLTDDTTVRVVEHIVLLAATAVTEIKRLVFVGNMVDSAKFLVLLYLLTYVGDQTNGLTLVMSAVICAFSLPLCYRLQQARIEGIVKAVNSSLERGKLILDSVYELIYPPRLPPPCIPPAAAPAIKAKQKTK